MSRLGARRLSGLVVGVVVLGGVTAHAQTFEERFSALGLRGSFPEAVAAAPAQPAPAAEAPVPTPRPAPAARGNSSGAAPPALRARQEELVSAYAAQPSSTTWSGGAQNSFYSWLPRLLPTSVDKPATAAGTEPTTVDALSGRRWYGRKVPSDLAAMIAAKAQKHGVPLPLAHAVVTVESNYNPRAHGRGATIGLMQIKHPTARSLGFAGSVQDLYDPAHNLEYGMQYLGEAHRLAKGDICGTVMRYQGGLRAVRMSRDASVYCARVHQLLASEPSGMRDAKRVAGSRRVAESATATTRQLP